MKFGCLTAWVQWKTVCDLQLQNTVGVTDTSHDRRVHNY